MKTNWPASPAIKYQAQQVKAKSCQNRIRQISKKPHHILSIIDLNTDEFGCKQHKKKTIANNEG